MAEEHWNAKQLREEAERQRFVTLDSGQHAEYASGMVRDTQDGKARFGLLRADGVPYADQFFTRVAQLMTRGIGKYGLRNWEKADSQEEIDRFKESAERHLNQYLAGETDEDHAAAVVFNLLAAETTEFKMRRTDKAREVLSSFRAQTMTMAEARRQARIFGDWRWPR